VLISQTALGKAKRWDRLTFHIATLRLEPILCEQLSPARIVAWLVRESGPSIDVPIALEVAHGNDNHIGVIFITVRALHDASLKQQGPG
jgi:hypothetical protein